MIRRILIIAALYLVRVHPVISAGELTDLAARLDAIESENETLRKQLEELKAADESLVGRVSKLDEAAEFSKTDKTKTASPSRSGEKKEDPLSFSAKWNHGFEAITRDKRFKFHVGGRVQYDGVWIQDDANAFAGAGPFADQDSVNFRRARIRADGTMYETIDWCCEYDFVNSVNVNPGTPAAENNIDHVTAPTDLWVTFREIPLVSNIRVGNVKEPIGFEHLHSSRYLDFMERSYGQDAFYGAFNNGFTPGILIFDNWAEERGTWSTGFFKNTSNAFAYGIGEGEYAWTSRITGLPWYEEEGRYLAHLGVSGSIRDPNNGQQQYRARGSLRNGPGGTNPVISNTDLFRTTQVELGGLEAAVQMDSLLLEAEYTCAWNENSVGNGTSAPADAALGDVFFYGWYAQALYFLTGEHRDYEKKTGVFGRVIPHKNFGECGSLGAWQIGARYNVLNLVDSGVDGGRLEDVTLGLNWFLNPNLKLQNNYTYTVRDAQAGPGQGDYYGFGTRLAWDF